MRSQAARFGAVSHQKIRGTRSVVENVVVAAPSSFTIAFASTYFRHLASRDRAAELSVDLRFAPISGKIRLGKPVSIDVRSFPGSNEKSALRVFLTRADGGAIPRYTGMLSTTALTDATCRMTLGGSYALPRGIMGRALDAIVGRRLMSSTILKILVELSHAAEQDYFTRTSM